MASVLPRRTLLFAVLLPFLLGGCVNYQLGLEVGWDGKGLIQQRVQVESFVATLAQPQIEDFQKQLQPRVQQLGGTLARDSESLTVTIPFDRLQDIEGKLQQFFAPTATPTTTSPTTPWLAATAQSFRVETSHYGLASYYRLTGSLDPSTLAQFPIPYQGRTFRVTADRLLTLQLSLTLPLGALSTNATQRRDRTLVWDVPLNQVTPIEVAFLLPNLPVLGGIGLGLLGASLWLGKRYLETKRFS